MLQSSILVPYSLQYYQICSLEPKMSLAPLSNWNRRPGPWNDKSSLLFINSCSNIDLQPLGSLDWSVFIRFNELTALPPPLTLLTFSPSASETCRLYHTCAKLQEVPVRQATRSPLMTLNKHEKKNSEICKTFPVIIGLIPVLEEESWLHRPFSLLFSSQTFCLSSLPTAVSKPLMTLVNCAMGRERHARLLRL